MNSVATTDQFGGIGDAGPIGLALGFERRDDQSAFRPDEFLAGGDVLGFGFNWGEVNEDTWGEGGPYSGHGRQEYELPIEHEFMRAAAYGARIERGTLGRLAGSPRQTYLSLSPP